MKFSFLTYQFCRFPLEYSFKMAQRYGFSGVEVWGGRPHGYTYDMKETQFQDISRWKREYDVKVSMFTPEILAYPYSFVSPLKEERTETLAYLCKCAETAAAMETSRMQITVPHTGYATAYESAWEWMREGISDLTERAAELGVNIVVESLSPSEGNMLTTSDDLARLLAEIDNPYLKVMLDVVPPVIANEPLSAYFERFGENMDYIHICNSDGKTELHLQLDDREGVLSIPDMFQVFKNYNYDGWCSLELLAPYFKDPELYLAQAKRIIDLNFFGI